MSIAPGTSIGPYEIVGWLGAGGMGDVYRARDARLGRDVAIKVIAAEFATDASRVRRFEQEARAAGQLNHPNILVVYDVGQHAGAPYLVTELLDGESLRSRLRQGFGAQGPLQGRALPARKAIDWARQAAEGLAAAHDKGIVHRDVKPDNLFITSDGRVKILDFGIAKLTAPRDDMAQGTGIPTDTAAGTVVGTAGYMSPEQVRGEAIDARSDIFSVGTVLYEMLTGQAPFSRDTSADSMAAILKEEPSPTLPADVPPALARIVSRCLEKTREARFQSARDLAFGLEVLSGTHATAVAAPATPVPRRWRTTLGVGVVVASLAIAIVSWVNRTGAPGPASAPHDPLTDATYSQFTHGPGTEAGAEISPDGRFVAFISDQDGEFDLFVSQVGTGHFSNLTLDIPALRPTGALLRTFGFSGDGSEIWLMNPGDPGAPKLLLPITGGKGRALLGRGDGTPAWSPDGARLAYFNHSDGDPMFVAGRHGGDPRQIVISAKGEHNHNPAWSPDAEWIYFVHGPEATTDMDVWRIRPSGGALERLTHQNAAVSFLAVVDAATLLYIARARDGSGPWLWSLDVPSRVTRRVSAGLDHYTYVSASRDGRRVVAAVARRTASLWRVPILDRPAEDRDVTPYPLPAERALAPRFAGTALFYLSARGTGDGLWRFDAGQVSQVWNPTDGALSEPAVPSRDGKRVTVVMTRDGKRHLTIVSADGTKPRTLAASIDIQGMAGQASVDWSPDGAALVAGGAGTQGPGLYKIPVDGGASVRLAPGQAVNPVWSPDGQLILYAGPFVGGRSDLLGVRPDGTPVELPMLRVRPGGYRFLPGGTRVVYLAARDSLNFWILDLVAKSTQALTQLGNYGEVATFDVTADGAHIVFDRARDNSDVVQIDLRK